MPVRTIGRPAFLEQSCKSSAVRRLLSPEIYPKNKNILNVRKGTYEVYILYSPSNEYCIIQLCNLSYSVYDVPMYKVNHLTIIKHSLFKKNINLYENFFTVFSVIRF